MYTANTMRVTERGRWTPLTIQDSITYKLTLTANTARRNSDISGLKTRIPADDAVSCCLGDGWDIVDAETKGSICWTSIAIKRAVILAVGYSGRRNWGFFCRDARITVRSLWWGLNRSKYSFACFTCYHGFCLLSRSLQDSFNFIFY